MLLRCSCYMNVGIWDYCLSYFVPQDQNEAKSSSVYKMTWCSHMASNSLKQFSLKQSLMKLYGITMTNKSVTHHCLWFIVPLLVKILASFCMIKSSSLTITPISSDNTFWKKMNIYVMNVEYWETIKQIYWYQPEWESILIQWEPCSEEPLVVVTLIAFFSFENTKISAEVYCQFIKAWQLGNPPGKPASLIYLDEIALSIYINKDTLTNGKNKHVK